MTDPSTLQKLMSWLSPAFPVGMFAYSAGLESAIADNRVRSPEALDGWLSGNLAHGSGCTDALFVALAHKADGDPRELCELADMLIALTPARERVNELQVTGAAFVAAAAAWPVPLISGLPRDCPYPVAIGAIAGAHNIALSDLLTAWLTAYVQSQISVAIRLVPMGQTEGLRLLAAFEGRIADCARHAASGTLDDIGAIGYATDIATMAHETLGTRIFRS